MLRLRTGAIGTAWRGITTRDYTANRPLPPRPPRSTSLAGTVPYHTSYLLLHAQAPPVEWPSTFTSSIYLDIKRRLKDYHGLVNFCWRGLGEQPTTASSADAYSATLWKKSSSQEVCHRIEIPIISMEGVGNLLDPVHISPLADEENVVSSGPYFYICTHMNRDCRCGIRGSEFLMDLKNELDARGMLFDTNGNPRVAEVGHVGGHKNSPNLLVFPHGDWYGNLESKDLPGLLDHYIRSLEEIPIPPSLLNGPNRLQWRGRLGMTQKEQSDAFHSVEWGVTNLLGFSGLL